MIAALALSLAPWLAPQDAAPRVDPLAAVADALDLGLAAEAVELGQPLVAPGASRADDGRARSLVARALFLTGREDEAAALLARDGVTPATEPDLVLARAWLAIQQDRYDDVRRLLSAPEDSDDPLRYPDRAEPWLYVGRALARAGRPDIAEPYLKRFLQLAPLDPEAASAWSLLAAAARMRGDAAALAACNAQADALREWTEVVRARRLQIRANPEDPLPRYGLAAGWMEVERYAEATAVLDALLAVAPDYARAWFLLGEARRLTGDDGGALAAYDRCLELDDHHHAAQLNRGVLRRLRGDAAGARADLQHVVDSEVGEDPQYAVAHLELARLLLAAGEAEAADARYAVYRDLGGAEPLEPAAGGGEGGDGGGGEDGGG